MSSKLRILRIKKNTGTNSQKMSQACESVKESMFTHKLVVQKLGLEKNVFTKKWSPKLIFLNGIFFLKTFG